MADAVNLDLNTHTLGMPTIGQFQLLIASVNTQTIGATVNAPSKFLNKPISVLSITTELQSQVQEVRNFVNTQTVDSAAQQILTTVKQEATQQGVEAALQTPLLEKLILPEPLELAPNLLTPSHKIVSVDHLLSIGVEYQEEEETVTQLVEVFSIDSVLQTPEQLQILQPPGVQSVEGTLVSPIHNVIKLVDTFEVGSSFEGGTPQTLPGIPISELITSIPEFLIIIDSAFRFGVLVFEQEDTWEVTVVSDDNWIADVTSNDTWEASFGDSDMLIVSRDHIEIVVDLKQNANTNYNIVTGSTVKASIVHSTLPTSLVGPVTLVEDEHWTAGGNTVTAEFDAGYEINTATAKLEIQVTPPNGKTKSFFSPKIIVRQDTID